MKRGKLKTCLMNDCKKEFYEYPYQIRKFCSRIHANKFNAEDNSRSKLGRKNPMYGKRAWNSGLLGVIKHPSNSGNHCHFWRGGKSREKYKLRRTGKWKLWRLRVFERDKYTCCKCRKVGGDLVPHHIRLFAYYPNLRFVVSNGVTVCKKCHHYLHRWENQRKKIINISD